MVRLTRALPNKVGWYEKDRISENFQLPANLTREYGWQFRISWNFPEPPTLLPNFKYQFRILWGSFDRAWSIIYLLSIFSFFQKITKKYEIYTCSSGGSLVKLSYNLISLKKKKKETFSNLANKNIFMSKMPSIKLWCISRCVLYFYTNFITSFSHLYLFMIFFYWRNCSKEYRLKNFKKI